MNRYSRTVTQPKDQGASQVRSLSWKDTRLVILDQAMLYATEGINSDEDFQKAMVGVASVWCVIRVCSYAFTHADCVCTGMRVTRAYDLYMFCSLSTNHM